MFPRLICAVACISTSFVKAEYCCAVWTGHLSAHDIWVVFILGCWESCCYEQLFTSIYLNKCLFHFFGPSHLYPLLGLKSVPCSPPGQLPSSLTILPRYNVCDHPGPTAAPQHFQNAGCSHPSVVLGWLMVKEQTFPWTQASAWLGLFSTILPSHHLCYTQSSFSILQQLCPPPSLGTGCVCCLECSSLLFA